MRLRAWRLYSRVIGTIFTFAISILLLFAFSSDNRNQQRSPPSYDDTPYVLFEAFRRREISLQWCRSLRFLDGDGDGEKNKVTALASFGGSGNTWLRYLLQQATGIYAGSVYKDVNLLQNGFPGENIYNSSVIIVKTHQWGQDAWKHFDRAVLLVRDPDKAIKAEFNRESGGHKKLWEWEQVNLHWARNFTGEVEIIYYEDLVEDVEGVLRQILRFINFPINEDLLKCALSRKEGLHHRKKVKLPFDPFTPEMYKAIEEKKREVYRKLGRF